MIASAETTGSVATTTFSVRPAKPSRLSAPAKQACRILLVAVSLFIGAALPACAWQFGVSATVQKSPATITLSWDQVPWGVATYTVYRSTTIGGNAGGGGSWTAVASNLSATSFADTSVTAGTEYEYRVGRTGSQFDGDAYIDTGIELPMQDSRGKLVLVVDNTYTTSLSAELTQLQSDLTGDGWTIIRHDVSRTATPASVKSLIVADYNADPSNVRSVLLVGRVPVLRSGNIAPDGHDSRTMPADGYYGDMTGDWSSSPSYIPADIKLQVGRVDLYDMPSFAPLTDTDLTRQYLNRDHNWRHKVFTVTPRQAEMTTATGDSIQRQFFGTATPTNIPNNYYPGDGYSPEFWNVVQNYDFLWFTKGTGGGQPNGCSGMGMTADYAASTGVKTVFNCEFASWFVEWDVTDNFLRAPLAAKGYALTDVWSDNPAWVFMHMAMGKPIGYSTKVSQNNGTYYNIPGYPGLPEGHRGVHLGLMGDPTLRMTIVAPVSNLSVAAGATSASLSWTASPDSSLQGYAIYRSASVNGPFARLNSSLVTGTTYSDASVSAGTYTYMVRAVKLEVTASGSYQNPSQGIFKTASIGGGGTVNQAPVVNAGGTQTITLPTTASLTGSVIDDGLPATPGTTTATWSTTSGPGTVTFGNASATTTTASFSTSGTYVLRLTANDGALSSFSEVTITVNPAKVNHAPVANAQAITAAANAVRIITLTGSDADSDPITFAVVANPTHGTLTGTAPNLTYTPAANYTGTDSFTFKVNDGIVDSAVATVALTINAVTNSSSADVVAAFHLDNDLSDATGIHGNLTLANGAVLDGSNLGWMSSPSGAALRVFNLFDRASISLPDSDLYTSGQTTAISIEARMFINRYVGYSVGNATLFELVKGWDSQFILSQDMWSQSPQILVGNQTLATAATMSSVLTTGVWHWVSITLDGTGYTVKVDGNAVAQLAASSDLAKWNGTGTATLQFGDFDGWIDEVIVHNTGATQTNTPPPALPTVTISATTPNASESGTAGVFTFTRTGSTTSALTVNYTLGGTAVSGSNYTSPGTSVTIPAGAASATVTLQPIHDNVFTGSLSVLLSLASNDAYTLGSPASATVTIADIDKPTVAVTASTPNASESGTAGVFTFTRTGSTTSSLTVNYTLGGTAVSGSNYTSPGTSVTIPAGATSTTVTVQPIHDNVFTGSLNVLLSLASNAAYTLGSPSSATVTIADIDKPTVAVTASTPNASESGTAGVFTFTRTGSTTAALTVNYTLGGTAVSGSNYTAPGTSVTIPAGAASATVTVQPIHDNVATGPLSVVLSVSANAAYTLGSPASATVTIADIDKPTVAVTASTPNASESGTAGVFTFTRTGTTAAALTVNYTLGGSAKNGSNYTTLGTSLSIPAGSASATVTVQPLHDSVFTGPLGVVLSLSANAAYVLGSPASSTVTIADIDQPVVTVTATAPNASESGTKGVFTFARTGSTAAALTVNYSLGGSAVNGTNYTTLGTSFTLAAGVASANLNVQPLHDGVFTGTLSVLLSLTTNAAYQLGSSASATVNIADIDKPRVKITRNGSSSLVVLPPPTNNTPWMSVSAPSAPGLVYLLQCTTNFLDWSLVATNAPGTSLDFVDSAAAGQARFYRLLFAPDSSPASVNAALAAQNFSANAVGFANLLVPPGFSLIANPLNGPTNFLSSLLSGVPDGSGFYKYTPGRGYTPSFFSGATGAWSPDATLNPGEGGFFNNFTSTNLVLTFAGDVPQGSLTNSLPAGYSIRSSMVPQAGLLDTNLGFPAQDGDTIYRFVNGGWQASYFEQGFGWAGNASLGIGEAVFVLKASATNWTRSFSTSN